MKAKPALWWVTTMVVSSNLDGGTNVEGSGIWNPVEIRFSWAYSASLWLDQASSVFCIGHLWFRKLRMERLVRWSNQVTAQNRMLAFGEVINSCYQDCCIPFLSQKSKGFAPCSRAAKIGGRCNGPWAETFRWTQGELCQALMSWMCCYHGPIMVYLVALHISFISAAYSAFLHTAGLCHLPRFALAKGSSKCSSRNLVSTLVLNGHVMSFWGLVHWSSQKKNIS